MMVDLDPDDVVERKAGSKGRVAIGNEYAGKTVKVAVLDVEGTPAEELIDVETIHPSARSNVLDLIDDRLATAGELSTMVRDEHGRVIGEVENVAIHLDDDGTVWAENPTMGAEARLGEVAVHPDHPVRIDDGGSA